MYGDVYVAGFQSIEKRHDPTFELRKAPLDASADRREARPASPTSHCAFETIRAARHTKQDPWTESQLAPGEYGEIERQLGRDEALSGYVKGKIRCVCS